jgi:hypothetical protein
MQLAQDWSMIERIHEFNELPEVYYDTGRKEYWILNSREEWITVNETSLSRLLKKAGLSSKRAEGEPLSPLENRLLQVQRECDVAYAGSLAGFGKGITVICGQRVLVTSSPRIITPVKGHYPTLERLFKNLFGEEQLPYVIGWLKVGYECLRAGRRQPGQVLVLAGKRNSGKSLSQKVFTEIFGGRAAKPHRYMSGGTDFNRDLFGAEHLMIEDEETSTDIRTRRKFGTSIKEFTVNEVQSCHGKNREAVTLTPFWRVSISVNDEPENLMILPPFDESIGDKITLLKVNNHGLPIAEMGREAVWNQLTAELPAFVAYLCDWEIPNELKCERFGITHHHHRDLLAAIDESAPETKLLALIDLAFETRLWTEPFEATAEELQSKLVNSLFDGQVKTLLSWSNACGTYLGRLARKHPDRVIEKRTNSQRRWRVEPPKEAVTP